MATIAFVDNESTGKGRGVLWTPLANGDVGQAIDPLDFADISVQVLGTFGVGGSVQLEGSNQATPTTWHILNDPQGNALTFTTAKLEHLLEGVRWVRPNVTAGDGTTALSVLMWARRVR